MSTHLLTIFYNLHTCERRCISGSELLVGLYAVFAPQYLINPQLLAFKTALQ